MKINELWPGWEAAETPIGRGGNGTVYEIRREVFGDVERSALKIIRIPRDPGDIDHLRASGLDDQSITNTLDAQVKEILQEYKVMMKFLDNPNFVHCQDFNHTRHPDGFGWDIHIRMELLTPLMKALDKVGTEEQIIRLGTAICNALVSCQAEHIIHRDIKPDNIFLSPKGVFKLGDFGIARVMEKTTHASLTGTPSYMAPEVFKGEAYGPTVDIYSLGMVLYWLLNERRLPFLPLPPATFTLAMGEEARIRRLSGEALPPPKNGSAELKQIVLKACAYTPKDRYQTARELMDALQSAGQAAGKTVAGKKPGFRPASAPGSAADPDATVLDRKKKQRPENATVREKPPVSQPKPEKQQPPKAAPKARGKKPSLGPALTRTAAKAKKLLPYAAVLLVVLFAGMELFSSKPAPADVPTATTSADTEVDFDKFLPQLREENRLVSSATLVSEFSDIAALPDAPAFGGPISRRNVRYIHFLGSVEAAEDLGKPSFFSFDDPICWDASEKQNGAVMVWAKKNGDLYDLYIGADGGCWAPRDCAYLFAGYTHLEEIQFAGAFEVFRAASMRSMFRDCGNLPSLDLPPNFDTSAVTDMDSMFKGCRLLERLDLSRFDTSAVTDMGSMFEGCSSLTSLDISSFDTSSVVYMNSMFYECGSLTELDVSGFDTASVTNMGHMFADCGNLTQLNVSGFNTASVTQMGSLFSGCSKLMALDVSKFDTSAVTGMYSMFYGCNALTQLDVSGFNTASVTDMENMFAYCSGLSELDVSSFDTSAVTSMSQMFMHCSSLSGLNIAHFNTSCVTDMERMFFSCTNLTSLDVSRFNTSSVTNMSDMFGYCKSLTQLDVSRFNTSSVTDMSWMFRCCSGLTTLDVRRFDTSNAETLTGMFLSCTNLTRLDIRNFKLSASVTAAHIFDGCSNVSTFLLGSHTHLANS